MTSQKQGLHKVIASTWGTMFGHARQVYNTIVRSALNFRVPIWYKSSRNLAKVQGLAKQLEKHQNECLQTVAGVYKATSIWQLETETFIPPLATYLNQRMAAYHLCQENSNVQVEIYQTCNKIRGRLLGHRQKASPLIPAVAKEAWAKRW